MCLCLSQTRVAEAAFVVHMELLAQSKNMFIAHIAALARLLAILVKDKLNGSEDTMRTTACEQTAARHAL